MADAGPLIGLARVGLLDLLRQLYAKVVIPTQVLEELQTSKERPGSRALLGAVEEGWLEATSLARSEGLELLSLALGLGEAAAILLAGERPCRFLLLDERRGRRVAANRGLRVVGTGGILVAAKKQGLLARVSDVLDQLAKGGYRLSPELRKQILLLAEEGEEVE